MFTARQMAWRAVCPKRDCVCNPSSQLMVGAIFLIHMASLIQRPHFYISLSTTIAPSQSITQLCLLSWSLIADLGSTFVEYFRFSRVKRSCYRFNFFLLFIQSRVKCSSGVTDVRHVAGVGFGIGRHSYFCLPLLDELVFLLDFCVV